MSRNLPVTIKKNPAIFPATNIQFISLIVVSITLFTLLQYFPLNLFQQEGYAIQETGDNYSFTSNK